MPTYPIAAPALSVASSTAKVPPLTTTEYSPTVTSGNASGSKYQLIPALIGTGAAIVNGLPPPRRWNVSVGATSPVPPFWMSTPFAYVLGVTPSRRTYGRNTSPDDGCAIPL